MFKKSPSIRRQLLIFTSMVLITINSIAYWTASYYASRSARLSYDRLLLGAAFQMAENINSFDGKVNIDLPRSAFETLALAPIDRAFYSIIDNEKFVLTGYKNLPDIPFDHIINRLDNEDYLAPGFYDTVYLGSPARFVALPIRLVDTDKSKDIIIAVGQTLLARNALAKEMSLFFLQFVGVFFVVSLVILMFGIWRVLQPLQSMKKAISSSAPLDLNPITIKIPDEIVPLLETINLSRLQLRSTLERLKRFTAEAAHQLRTPLAGLNSQAQNALEETDPDLRKQQIEHILNCSNQLTEIVNQLLNQAKLTHRFQSKPLEPISLDHAIKSVCRDLVVWALQKDVEIEYLSEMSVNIEGDDFAIRQMALNILENAIKYSPRHSRIEVDLTASNGEVTLQIRDQGVGVSDEEKSHIFDFFYRSPNNLSAGSGVGLAIAKDIADHHKATFHLRDNIPTGLVVEIAFPKTEGKS
jgi:two-component system sensor histidine kinase TctE|tara:strand:- start:44 stop:1453 length:1410 start_codon:yes stop_codon:yes gene_type:complete